MRVPSAALIAVAYLGAGVFYAAADSNSEARSKGKVMFLIPGIRASALMRDNAEAINSSG